MRKLLAAAAALFFCITFSASAGAAPSPGDGDRSASGGEGGDLAALYLSAEGVEDSYIVVLEAAPGEARAGHDGRGDG